MKIVIPGGSGQVGIILARHFHQQGHTVTVLSRAPKPAPWQVIRWDSQTVAHGPALEQSDVCINLTGRSVNCRYHTANRRQMYDSRIVSTRLQTKSLLRSSTRRDCGLTRAPPRSIATPSIAPWTRGRGNSAATKQGPPTHGIFPSGSQRIGRQLSSRGKCQRPADRHAQLHHLYCGQRWSPRSSVESGSQRTRRTARIGGSICFLDSRNRLCPRRRLPDRGRDDDRASEYLLPQSTKKPGVHARSSCFMGTTGWRTCSCMDDRNRRFPDAYGV